MAIALCFFVSGKRDDPSAAKGRSRSVTCPHGGREKLGWSQLWLQDLAIGTSFPRVCPSCRFDGAAVEFVGNRVELCLARLKSAWRAISIPRSQVSEARSRSGAAS